MTRKMKDSGIEWIGEIPEDWETIKLKLIVNTIKGYAFKSEMFSSDGIPVVKASDLKKQSVVKSGVYITEEVVSNYLSFKLSTNDILMTTVGSTPNIINSVVGQLALVPKELNGSLLNQNVVKLIPIEKVENLFMYYYLSTHSFRKYLDLIAHGTANQASLALKDILDYSITFPDYNEQFKIINFLDNKCSKIDETIQKEKQVIEKLKQYKQSVITEAVTKGLDPDVKMKDSGVEWIGEIPEHWEVKKLKYCIECNKNTLSEHTPYEFNIKYIDIGSVTNEEGIREVQTFNFINAPSRARRIVKKNDTIISTVRTYLKAISYISDEYDNFICSTGFAVCTPLECFIGKYMFYSLHSDWFVSTVESISTGISYPAINTSSLVNLMGLIPPLEEQEQIASYLDKKCASIDKAISNKEKLIEKLTEYKKSLIYECVTGKREV